MKPSDVDTLLEAIARNAPAILSLPSAGMVRHHKTRFLLADTEAFWVEAPPHEEAFFDALVGSRGVIGVAFKSQVLKVVFTTPVLGRDAAFRVNESSSVPAVKLELPPEVRAVQRREFYRVRVRPTDEPTARAWRIPEHHVLRDRPPAVLEMPVGVRDVGLGGIGLTFARQGADDVKLIMDQRLRILLRYGETELLLDGRVRFLKVQPDGNVQAGVKFQRMEADLEGRQTQSVLTRIVGELQRAEVRRMRADVPEIMGAPPG